LGGIGEMIVKVHMLAFMDKGIIREVEISDVSDISDIKINPIYETDAILNAVFECRYLYMTNWGYKLSRIQKNVHFLLYKGIIDEDTTFL